MKLGVRKDEKDFSGGEVVNYWGPLFEKFFLDIDGLEITNNLLEADLILLWNTIPSELLITYKIIRNPEKIILCLKESPVSLHRRMLYENIDRFFLVVCHNPKGQNQISFTSNPSYYPWGPRLEFDVIRKDTTIKNRNFFYAARKFEGYENLPNKFDTYVLYGARAKLVESFKNKYPNRLKLYGIGWGDYAKKGKSTSSLYKGKKKKVENWRKCKVKDVEESGADFHLVLENCIQENLITDHFHDGFISDRVVFYLGCPNIEDYVPTNIFVDLRPYYNKETCEFDIDKIVEIANNMTQEEYDGYIQRARAWRKALINKNEIETEKLSIVIANKVKNFKKEG